MQNQRTNNTKHNKYKCTYYQNTTQLSKHPYITKQVWWQGYTTLKNEDL
jgi:hypothetical protein